MLQTVMSQISKEKSLKNKLQDGKFYFLPLSGTNEIGMNLALYGYNGRWIVVDLGISFTNEFPGLNILMPDINKIKHIIDDIDGIFITHSHEDHVGAVQYLYSYFKPDTPIFCTPFTQSVLLSKTHNLKSVISKVDVGSSVDIGPFHVTFIPITHSIPESNCLSIQTEVGTVLHTGDWKLEDPIVGKPTDIQALKNLAPVLALVCDSTNVFEHGHSKSEREIQEGLISIVDSIKDGAIIAVCFASNVYRLISLIAAAEKSGRKIAFAGTSLKKISDIAHKHGYFKQQINKLISIEEALKLPRNEMMFVVTGSQGESRSALSKIVEEIHPKIRLQKGDNVIFSSRIIPGNEKSVYRMQNALVKKGINVIFDKNAEFPLHSSGHAYKEELRMMYEWTKPISLIPVHGTPMHLKEHEKLGKECNIENIVIPENGVIIQLNPIKVVDKIDTGIIAMDGKKILSFPNSIAIQDRMRIAASGIVFITIIVSTKLRKAVNFISLIYGIAENSKEHNNMTKELIKILSRELPREITQKNEKNLENETKRIVESFFQSTVGKSPVLALHIANIV